jgi:pimeloyl-ACP methyl ester carboxylesterase
MSTLPEPYEDTVVRVACGRELTVARWGRRGGAPIISHHGTPMSRLDLPGSPELLKRLDVDLIMYDRPGYGSSTPAPGRRVAGAAADAAAVADALGLGRFAVHGVSGGGPHALACAALLPDRVTRAASVVGLAPWSAMRAAISDGMSDANVEEFEVALLGRAALEDYVDGYVAAVRAGGDLLADWIDELPEPDQQTYRSPKTRAMFDRALVAALSVSGNGWVDDDLAFVQDWGFDLHDITVPVSVWVGVLDVLVPPDHGRFIAGQIPGAQLYEVPDRGHELDHAPILEWLCGVPGAEE